MKQNLAVIKAVKLAGGQAVVARALGVSAQAVNQWVKGARPVPRKRALRLERLVEGAYTARELSPKHFDEDGSPEAPISTPEAMARALAARGITVPPEEPPRAGAAASAEAYDPDAGRIVPFEELP